MKNMVSKVIVLLMLSSVFSYAKSVTICSAYLVGYSSEMECKGGINGKYTFASLYKNGWTYAGDISGVSQSFMLVFEK
jgi:hypothetical protein